MTEVYGDSVTLCERLQSAASNGGPALLVEALARIRQLEKLCAMMTDTGVLLEEDVNELVQPDVWWLADDSAYVYDNLKVGMEDLADPAQIVEWCRSHTLSNTYALRLEEVKDHMGRVVVAASVQEFDTYQQAEEALAEYTLQRRRAEGRL